MNKITEYTKHLLKSDICKINNEILEDYKLFINNSAAYYPNYICNIEDMTIFNKLQNEIINNEETNEIKWSKHYKYDNPIYLKTFNNIIKI